MTQQEINQLSFWEKQVIKVYNPKKSINEFFFIDVLNPNIFRLIELKPDLSEKIRVVELTPNDTDFNLRLNTLESKFKKGEAEVLFGEGDIWAGIVRKKSTVYEIYAMHQWAFVLSFDPTNNLKKSKKSSKDFFELIFNKKITLQSRNRPLSQSSSSTPTSTPISTPSTSQSPFQDFIDKLGFSDNCILADTQKNKFTIIPLGGIEYGATIDDFRFDRISLRVENGKVNGIGVPTVGRQAEATLESTSIAIEQGREEILLQKGDRIVYPNKTYTFGFVDDQFVVLDEIGSAKTLLLNFDEFVSDLSRGDLKIERNPNPITTATSSTLTQPTSTPSDTATTSNQPIEVKLKYFYKNQGGTYIFIYAMNILGDITEIVFRRDFSRKEKYNLKESSDTLKKGIENGEWVLENPPNVPYNVGDKFYFKDLPSDVFTIDFSYTNDGIDIYNYNLKVDVVDSSGEVEDVVDLDDFKQLIDSGEVIFIKEEKTPPKQVAPVITYTSDEVRYKKLKKELEQILFLKSTISTLNFEERINVDTLFVEVKNEADALFFKITEDKLGQNEIIDTMFEQSFIPMQRRYDLGASDITGDNFAPNGTPSEIPESIYNITQTKDFTEWFGDYKEAYRLRNVKNTFVDCSTVVTENYEPQLVWHGSGHLFSYFLFERFPAAYFAVNKSYAEWFANRDETNQGGYLYPFFLDIRRPLDLTLFGVERIKSKEFLDWIYLQTGLEKKDLKLNPILLRPNAPELWAWSYLRNSPDFLAQIRDTNVFDGIVYYENNPQDIINRQENVTKAYIIFKPEQCKLAIPDRGSLLQASLKSFVLKKGGKI